MKRHAELLEIMQMNYSLFSVEIPALASSVIQDLDDLQIEPKKNQMQLLGNIKMLFEKGCNVFVMSLYERNSFSQLLVIYSNVKVY